ncbi:unnamed protein product [Cuscuta epithymum]|uniref:Uncharacterized protein n=1 Tax=Cuscuta epithymum TaxID=186058 RepID=A0AAV0F108_9ASTE|nr:unnamed protein product [Cuscuta epithymum]
MEIVRRAVAGRRAVDQLRTTPSQSSRVNTCPRADFWVGECVPRPELLEGGGAGRRLNGEAAGRWGGCSRTCGWRLKLGLLKMGRRLGFYRYKLKGIFVHLN